VQAIGQSSKLTASRGFLVNTNWRQFGYDLTHSGTNPYENVLSSTTVSNLTLDWNYPNGGYISSSLAIVDGVAYVGSYRNHVYALEAETAGNLWSYATANAVDSSPAVANGVVYIGSWDHNVYALDDQTGVKLWSFATGNMIDYSSPAVANGVVYIGSWDHNVY